jgi:hypothetical protein
VNVLTAVSIAGNSEQGKAAEIILLRAAEVLRRKVLRSRHSRQTW